MDGFRELAFFIPALVWLIPVTVVGWLALALYCAVYFALFAIAIRWASRLFCHMDRTLSGLELDSTGVHPRDCIHGISVASPFT